MRKNRKLIKIIMVVIFLASMLVSPLIARTTEDIQNDIDGKEQELEELQKQLDTKKNQLSNATNQKTNKQSELETVKAGIEQMEIELEVTQLELIQLQANYEFQILEKEKVEKQQEKQLTSLYMNWKGSEELSSFLLSKDDPIKQNYYLEIVTETDQEGLNETYVRLKQLEADIQLVEDKKAELEAKSQELAEKKKELESIVVSLQKQESSYSAGVKQLAPKITATQEELEMLSAEQKGMQDIESRLIDGDPGGATQPLQPGEYYFAGQGRDLYQGHGVGMSQFGAYGAARSGWSASQIVKHYYKGVTVGQGSGTVNIIGGRQNIPLEEYVAGAGEVPNKACGSADQAASNPAKYVVDNPSTVWDCWPEEAIKAQMIAYRTYGLRNKNVYPDARSQVYTGTTLKQWAADETQEQVLYYNGSLISAVYSSDNNNGWGTADNDTVWSNYSGDGTPYPYLRATYDENITYHYTWSTWTYRTNSYSINEMNSMLEFASTSGSVSSSARNFMAGARSTIGTLQSVEFVRDSSGRVKKVKLNGDKGSKYIAGWLFKSLWNVWVGTVKPSGEVDYIYSLTYSLIQIQ